MPEVSVYRRGVRYVAVLDEADLDRLDAIPGWSLSINKGGYIRLFIWAQGQGGRGQHHLLHRWIMGCAKRDGKIVDHHNRNKMDNRRANLRFATPAESTINRGPSINASRWGEGVDLLPSGRFRAHVTRDHKRRHLGVFDTAADALAARRSFLQEYDN